MERKNETAIESRSCWATKSRTDFLLLFHLSLFQTRCGSIYRRLHCTDIKMSQLGSALALSELQILTRKCSFHLNNVIKVDLHLKREGRGVEQPRSLRAFSDCNMRFRLGGEMNVNLCVCAPQIESFNYFSAAIWFSALVVFMTVSQFWRAKAKYWSHKCMSSNCLTEKRRTL